MNDDLRSKFLAARENQILLGQKSGSIEGLQERSGVHDQSSERQRDKDKAKRKEINRFIEILERVRHDLSAIEEGFRDREGDAWRENLALKILEPDDVPQRRDNESIGDYRMRLETHLIDEMLDPDGSIKNKYKSDTKLSDYAQWAQKKFNYNRASGLVRELENENTTPDRRQDILEELEQRANIEELTFADRNSQQRTSQDATKNIADNFEDSKLGEASASVDIDNLLAPKA